MMEQYNFDDIRPYTDEEAARVLKRLSWDPYLLRVSKYLFPSESLFFLSDWIRRIKTVEELQTGLMNSCVNAILDKTSTGLSVKGIDNIRDIKSPMVIVSNHRDIVLDPAFIQIALINNGIRTCQLCVGNNLLQLPLVRGIMRSNKMVIVRRGISGREQLLASQELSAYIRKIVTEGTDSVWLAQKQGRAKDGMDRTSRGVLKMLAMSGKGDFVEDLKSLNIVPVSISYEYESCDYMKARELYLSRGGEYYKKRGEDIRSILEGITQQKGGICLNFCKPITEDELRACAKDAPNKNVAFKALADLMDDKIRGAYHIFDTNRYALDLLEGREVPESFVSYVESRLDKAVSMHGRKGSLDRDVLRKIFLSIYANPLAVSRTGMPVQDTAVYL